MIGRAIKAAGATRPAHLHSLAAEDDFPRTEQGFADLLCDGGLSDVSCGTLVWDHRAPAEEWWSGPAAGVASIGQVVASQPAEVVTEIKRHYDSLRAEFVGPDGVLVLPHAALLGTGRA